MIKDEDRRTLRETLDQLKEEESILIQFSVGEKEQEQLPETIQCSQLHTALLQLTPEKQLLVRFSHEDE